MAGKTAKKKPSPGTTAPTQMRLGPDTLAGLDRIQAEYGLPSKTDAVRIAVATTVKALDKKGRK